MGHATRVAGVGGRPEPSSHELGQAVAHRDYRVVQLALRVSVVELVLPEHTKIIFALEMVYGRILGLIQSISQDMRVVHLH